MKKEYQDNDIVKALLNAGFTKEYIEKAIESKEINIEKSKTAEELSASEDKEKANAKDDEDHIENLKKDKEEDDEDEKDLKRDKKMKETIEKSLSSDFAKSLGETIAAAMAPSFDKLSNELAEIKGQTPTFKGANLSAGIIQKSMDDMMPLDDAGKRTVSVSSQRGVARNLIEKAIEGADSDLMKSIGGDAKSFLMNPDAETVGESLAMFMFGKGVKFVQ